MSVAFIKISEDGTVVARPSFTRDELHLALDEKVTLLRVEAAGWVYFYDTDGEWKQLAEVDEQGEALGPKITHDEPTL